MRSAVLVAVLLTAAASAVAGQSPTGRTADTATGPVGQRQTRAEAAPNIDVTGRIDSRVRNRIESRLRNRIDRYYDPAAAASATSALVAAGDRARTAGRPPGR